MPGKRFIMVPLNGLKIHPITNVNELSLAKAAGTLSGSHGSWRVGKKRLKSDEWHRNAGGGMFFGFLSTSVTFLKSNYILGGYRNALLSGPKTRSSIQPGFEPGNPWIQGCDGARTCLINNFDQVSSGKGKANKRICFFCPVTVANFRVIENRVRGAVLYL